MQDNKLIEQIVNTWRVNSRVNHSLLQSIKSFKRNPVRWMGYLISHESHHRGQIALALKQNGMRLPQDIAIHDLWRESYWGKT